MLFGLFGVVGAFIDAAWKGLTGKSSTASKMAYRQNWAREARGGTDAATAFANITNAHCDPDELIFEFGMDQEGGYEDPELGCSPWEMAYREALEEVMDDAMVLQCDPEDLIDWDEVEEVAYDYAYDYAERLMSGTEWIPDEEMLDWAFYDVSDHNM